MTTEVQQQTDDKLWEQVQQDRAGATQAEPINAEPGAKGDAADPLAGVPDETRKLIEGLEAKMAERDQRLHTVGQQLATAHGTMGSMKQQLDESRELLKKIAPTVATVEAQKKADEQKAADDAIAKRKALREKLADFPEVLEYVDSVLPADVKPAAKVEEKPAVVEQAKVEEVPNAAETIRVLNLQRELSDRVPGWLKIRETPEFKAWLPAQNAAIKARCESWDPDEAASVFQAFEKHKVDAAKVAQVEKDRQERLNRGEGIQGRGGSPNNVDTGADALWNKVTRDRAKAQAA